LNHGPTLSRDFVKTHFQQGKSRGPDFSKFGAVGIQIYMGSHHNLKRELKDDDIDIPYSAGGDIRVIYSGTFTNLSELNEQDEDPTSILIQLYRDYGFEQMLVLLKGEFSLILLDQSMSVENCILYVARDAFGIAPLYISDFENQLPIAFASERAMLEGFYSDSSPRQVEAGTYSIYQLTNGVYQTWTPVKTDIRYYTLPLPKRVLNSGSDSMHMNFMTHIVDAVGPSFSGDSVACLVSGGLKSAVLASILAKKLDGKSQLKTYFVGFTNDSVHSQTPPVWSNVP
jgi:asparagine synthetase B (glutamine-hydrolysing)